MRKTILALAGLSWLSACDLGITLPGFGRDMTGDGIRTMALLDGAVRVRGPRGYCVDQSASAASRGFAIMAGCAMLSERAATMPDRAGLITVQFGAPGSALVGSGAADLAEVLRDDAGQGMLSSGEAGVEVGEVQVDDNRVMVRFEDHAGAPIPGTTPLVWRGFTDIGDRLVTVSVLAYDRDPLSGEAGRTLLDLALRALKEVNGPAPSDA
jgi:hypothetical protein